MEKSLMLQKLEGALTDLQTIPLWGTPPLFPWDSFAAEISNSLDLKDLEISHHKTEWASSQNLTAGMGETPIIQAFNLSPIPGTLLWIMPQKSREALVQLLLTKEEKNKGFSDSALQEGFYHFILVNVLKTFNRKGLYGDLVASLSDETELPEDGALAIDISIKCGPTSLWARILCPPQTHASFSSYFSMSTPPLLTDAKLANIPLNLQLEIGSTTLFAAEWKKVKIGDLILLDRCSYDLKQRRGTAALTLGNTPLFDMRIREGEVKILEYALFQEEKPMTKDKDFSSEEPFEEDLSSMDNDTEGEHLYSTPAREEKTEQFLSSKQIPLTLVVEVSRIQMPLTQVTQLKPGNVLDLHLAPLPSVHLTIEGKRVAKGELVQLGETLGVKILNIGD